VSFSVSLCQNQKDSAILAVKQPLQPKAPSRVVGRLSTALPFWRDTIKASEYILSCIKQGYIVPFTTEPPAFYAANNQSAVKNIEFVRKTIRELLESNCIQEVSTMSHCCNPLTVAEGKKLRLVLDCSRHINKYVQYQQFKYESWQAAKQVIQPGCYMVTFDFKSGYNHLSLASHQCKYFGFSCTSADGAQHFYVFKQLPFGLSSACYIFTKLTRQLVKHWRRQGWNAFMYNVHR